VNPFPGFVVAPMEKDAVNGLRIGRSARARSPRASAPQEVEDRIDDGATTHRLRRGGAATRTLAGSAIARRSITCYTSPVRCGTSARVRSFHRAKPKVVVPFIIDWTNTKTRSKGPFTIPARFD
jgi:hypothetical protein